MLLDEAKHIVNANIEGSEGSFFYEINERNFYNVERFNSFLEALDIVVTSCFVDKEQMRDIVHLYSYFYKVIIYSMDSEELCKIKVPDEWREHLESFDVVVNKLFI